MKKKITLTFIIASVVIILDSFNAGHAFTAFVLTGVIPGTNITLSATAMMMVYALIAGFLFARIANLGRRTSSAPRTA